MLQVRVFASGSTGNSTLVRSGKTSILIDAGISASRLSKCLRSSGVDPGELSGIFVSHEHCDHIDGIRVFQKKYRTPVFISGESLEASGLFRERGDGVAIELISGGQTVVLGQLSITPFRVPHDAACTFGFCFEAGGVKGVQATDLGKRTTLLDERLRGSHCTLLEFNHDVERLMASDYPLHIKMRVRGSHGHLSNEQAGQIARQAVNGETRALFLMHLSEKNNHPALAMMAAREALGEARGMELIVTSPQEPTTCWEG